MLKYLQLEIVLLTPEHISQETGRSKIQSVTTVANFTENCVDFLNFVTCDLL